MLVLVVVLQHLICSLFQMLLLSDLVRLLAVVLPSRAKPNAVTDFFSSKQLLPFNIVEHFTLVQSHQKITLTPFSYYSISARLNIFLFSGVVGKIKRSGIVSMMEYCVFEIGNVLL